MSAGEPLLLREALSQVADPALRLPKTVFRVAVEINRVTPLTPTALVSFAMLEARDLALDLEQVRRLATPLLDYATRRSLPGPIDALREPEALRAGLDSLVDGGVLERYDGGSEAVWSIASGGHHAAAFYRNAFIHHLVNRAIAELALALAAPDADRDDVLTRALTLRDLLKFEFFFPERDEFRTEIEAELDLIGASAGPPVAHGVLRSFLDAQLVAAEQLAAHPPSTPVERNAFLRSCRDVGRQAVLQGNVHGAESVSRELFAGAFKLAANRQLLEPADDVEERREAWLDELRGVVAGLRRLDADRRAVVDRALNAGTG